MTPPDLPPLPEPDAWKWVTTHGNLVLGYEDPSENRHAKHMHPLFDDEQMQSYALAAIAAYRERLAGEWQLVPLKFLQGFNTLAHNYSMKAEPPSFYGGTEGDAFSRAYARCGEDLARLRAMLSASPHIGEKSSLVDSPRRSGQDLTGEKL